ncbi:MAG: hypothetical protein HYZ26_02820 [Chloroflexi bacterium]|nr:hypothetical protein [Chloroflexota bacterium]
MNPKPALSRYVFLAMAGLFLSACGARSSEQALVGPQGPPGPIGPVGPPGESASAAQTYVGSTRCSQCHVEEYQKFALSGHPYQLTPVSNGRPPVFPYDRFTGGLPNPPDGYSWEDISYVVGGYGWKANFLDLDGYLITGEADSQTQYVYANELLETPKDWTALHAGEQKIYDCGSCHSTGYRPQGHQDGLEGILGTWEFPGVQCEACHGPGSLHAGNPYGYQMVLDRSSQACGACHASSKGQDIAAADGFEVSEQQYTELLNSKHFALSCVTCHDPHASSVYQDAEVNPEQGLNVACTGCHWQQTERKVSKHAPGFVSCLACHMAPIGLSAAGDLDQHRGDISSHLFSINVDPQAPQFSPDGDTVMPYLTLEYVCGSCHNGEIVTELPVNQLAEVANGYHDSADGDGD